MQTKIHNSDLVVFCHLKWDFVFQRPQHLMSRFAKHRRVYFFEPPVIGQTTEAMLHVNPSKENVHVVIPHLPNGMNEEDQRVTVKDMIHELLDEQNITDFTAWYYNPKSLMWSHDLKPSVTVYDCMDELSGFKDCPLDMKDWEKKLLELADVVFTGGNSLYEAKKARHHNIHPFPSSIDFKHFCQSRAKLPEPFDQKDIPHPRIGFYGVIEERIDMDLLEKMAKLRPDYHFIMVGPVIRLEDSQIPKLPNLHFLGKKDYQELPLYLSSWDCAMMPFAINDATRFISPTKTPEFLAAGKPVVSTAINDVVYPYASPANLIHIANNAEDFIEAIELVLESEAGNKQWLKSVDDFLDGNSWDKTFLKMAGHEAKIWTKKDSLGEMAFTERILSNNY
jgi:glycosyltransferase involved in cell wall biosynthesis